MYRQPLRSRHQARHEAWWRQFLLAGDPPHSRELPLLTASADEEEDEPAARAQRRGDDGPAEPQPPPQGPSENRCAEKVPPKLRHIKVAADRGHLEAMFLLAQECEDRAARIHWLTMAAERGHVAAMHELGMASSALHERRRWLLRAARLGWAEAMAELGDVECS